MYSAKHIPHKSEMLGYGGLACADKHPSACVSSVMRLVTSIEAIRSKDNTWDLVRTYLWTYVDILSAGTIRVLPSY